MTDPLSTGIAKDIHTTAACFAAASLGAMTALVLVVWALV